MSTHSANDSPIYLGTGLINGVLCHRWMDGSTLPIFRGAADEDDEDDSGDQDGDEDDGDDGDDDSSDDDDGDDKDKDGPSEKSKNRAHRDAAKYRTQRNAARTERDDFKKKYEDEVAAHAKTKTDGTGDEALKTEIATLKTELDDLKTKLAARVESDKEAKATASVEEALDDLDIAYDDLDWVIVKLRKSGMFDVDEDGDVEDLTANLKKLLKKGTLKKKAASGDDDDDDKDSSSGGSRSGRSSKGSDARKKNGYDAAKLAKKYPALRH